jgi:hypothetical protein
MSDDEKFFAWLDGELSGDEAAAMERRAHDDPRLAELADRHRAMQVRLKAAFDPIAEAPVPERLSNLTDRHEVIDLGAARDKRRLRWLPQGVAIAASLAAGVWLGTRLPQGEDTQIQANGAQVYAAAALDEGLNRGLASAPSGQVRIGVTFRSTDGAICRSFTEGAQSGLACRSGERWRIRGMFVSSQAQQGDYRMAAGMDPALAALVGSTMSGAPFDARAEQEARQRGWR